MSTPTSERDFRAEASTSSPRRGSFVEWSKTPLAMIIGAALVLAVVAAFFLGVIRDHKSSLEHCVEAGGSFDRAYGNCTMPGEEVGRR